MREPGGARGASVAVIEAEEPGFGASGRNTGFIVPSFTAGLGPADIDRLLGPALGERLSRFVGGSAAFLFSLIAAQDIACDAEPNGWLQPAHSSARLALLEARVREWQALGQPVRLLGRHETEELTGSRAYLGALLDRSGGEINLICLPGGPGVGEALADVETIDFVRREGGRTEYATSVCMCAFLLGAAEPLKGRRATTHWAYVDLLPVVGATHEKARVVRDGNVFTAGGVTSGIDFAFRIVAELAGPEVAQAIQLGIEYDPSPPFDAGHPDKAATALMIQRNAMARTRIEQELEKLAILTKV